MTFQQYIDNPLGKQNAVFSQREMYRAKYTKSFDALLLREAGKIQFFLYYDKAKDTYLCHMKIPSETVTGFYYDVVIKFSTADNGIRVAPSLKDYDVQFFSNDPAFVFTYARVFLKNKMYIEDCKPKGSKLAHKQDPNERNPYQIPGYVKSIYFAYLFMKQKNLFSKVMYTTAGERYSKNRMLANITQFDLLMAERKEKEEKQKAQEKNAKKPERTPPKDQPKTTHSMKGVNKLVNDAVRQSKISKRSKVTPKVGIAQPKFKKP